MRTRTRKQQDLVWWCFVARLAIAMLVVALVVPVDAQVRFERPLAEGFNYATLVGGRLPGVEREFLLVVPEDPGSSARDPRPLLIALHGTGGLIEEYATGAFATLIAYAVEQGWFVLVPQALSEDPVAGTGKIRWNTLYPNPQALDPSAPDDLRFIRELTRELVDRLPIDDERVYATGFSGGGTMAQLLAATQPDAVAAVAVSGSSRGTFSIVVPSSAAPSVGPHTALITLPEPMGPVPALIIHGTKEEEHETKRPYAGGFSDNTTANGKTQITPVWDQVEYWTSANQCLPVAEVSYGPQLEQLTLPDDWDERRWRAERYAACHGRAEVVFVTAIGLPHSWPTLSKWGFDGDRMIVDFLASH